MTWTIRLGDCLDPVTGLASLPDKSVDHAICDPPYEAEAHTLQRRTKKTGAALAAVIDCPLDFAPVTPAVRAAVAHEFARLSRRWVIVFCQAEAVQTWREVFEAAGLRYKRACIWVKPDAMPQLTGDRPGMGYESIVCAHVPGRSTWNGGGRVGVYIENKNRSDLQRAGHPTQKPLALMESLIRDFTDPGELILDPFAGSGTTGVACRRLGRSFIGWERDPKYHAIAEKRISEAREQLSLIGHRKQPAPKQDRLAFPPTAPPSPTARARPGSGDGDHRATPSARPPSPDRNERGT